MLNIKTEIVSLCVLTKRQIFTVNIDLLYSPRVELTNTGKCWIIAKSAIVFAILERYRGIKLYFIANWRGLLYQYSGTRPL